MHMVHKMAKLCDSNVTYDLNECAYHNYMQALKHQKKAYQKVLMAEKKYDKLNKKLSIKQDISNQTILAMTRQSWEKYQKLYCRSVQYTYGKGTLNTSAFFDCMASLSDLRTAMLQSQNPTV